MTEKHKENPRPLSRNPTNLTELSGIETLEAQAEVQNHLQIKIDKPCVSAYFSGSALPEPGFRSSLFFALAAELRRTGKNQDQAMTIIENYYEHLPEKITKGPSRDGKGFSLQEAKYAVKSAYKSEEIKASGCNSDIWQRTCSGKDTCHFYQQIKKGKEKQGRTAGLNAFIKNWLPLLTGNQMKVYIGLTEVEKKRGYKPGATLFVSWREISKLTGISRQHIGRYLEQLFWEGLIYYIKGIAKQRGTASTITRVIPVPIPSKPKRI